MAKTPTRKAGVSPVVATVLLIAITVVSIGVVGAFVVGITPSEPLLVATIDIDGASNNSTVLVLHHTAGGQIETAFTPSSSGTISANDWVNMEVRVNGAKVAATNVILNSSTVSSGTTYDFGVGDALTLGLSTALRSGNVITVVYRPANQEIATVTVLGLTTTSGTTTSTTTTTTTTRVTISGGWDKVWITPSTHEYCVQNNVWGASTPQTLEVDDQTGAFTVTVSSHNNPTDGAPASYPSIFRGNHWGTSTDNSGVPKQVGNIASANTSWNVSVITSGAWNCAYDIWFHKTGDYTGGSPNGAELMIWINYLGSIQPGGSNVATVSLAGATWEVWFRSGNPNYIAYRRTTKTTSVSFDLNAFIEDAVSRDYIDDSWYLVGVEAGFEIWQGGQGLAVNSFSASVSGSGGG